jgi:hypothetical protein
MHEPHPRAQLYGQVRTGRVSAVGKTRHTVEVEFFEGDGFVSWDLHVLVTRPGDYSLPAKDTPVLCLLIEGRLGVGYVLGAIYTDADEAPLDDDGKRSIAGDDIRLGDPDADDKVALAPLVKDELDKIKTELDNIKTGLSTHTHPYTDTPVGPATTDPPAAPPYNVGYSPTEPAAENVSAK